MTFLIRGNAILVLHDPLCHNVSLFATQVLGVRKIVRITICQIRDQLMVNQLLI